MLFFCKKGNWNKALAEFTLKIIGNKGKNSEFFAKKNGGTCRV